MNDVKLVECPRDAMQGWPKMIDTKDKITYLNKLLKVGFDVLDFGSFVSPKAIPQMADTKEVLRELDMPGTGTKLLAIIANTRGAAEAVSFDNISYLGFPFSISETFQLRNTNKSIAASLKEVEEIQNLCLTRDKELVLYISMAFGNPYGDDYSAEIAFEWFKKLHDLGVRTIAMADTIGAADVATIEYIFNRLIPEFPGVEIGAHFHSTPQTWEEKVESAYNSGCRRFDSSLKGVGGCPMAKDELVGNIATENIIAWADRKGIKLHLNRNAFYEALDMAGQIFK